MIHQCLVGSVTNAVIKGLNIDVKIEEKYSHIDTTIRKLTHYGLYTIGGILLFTHISLYNISIKRKVIYSQVIGSIYSITDEIHQMFIFGRSGELRDILIDSLGIFTGILIVLLIFNFIQNERRKINEGT